MDGGAMKPGVARLAGGILAALAVLLAVAALTRVPYRIAADDEAQLRLSWRLRSDQVGVCVRPTPEELADLPRHMQNPDACSGTVPPFRLQVRVDGRTVVDDRVRPGGARADRPMYVLRELPVTPGPHQLEISFGLESSPEVQEHPAMERLRLDLEAEVVFGAREIVLVTLDPGTLSLVLRH